ncbi:S41 family peptidase [Streptomyces coacervatus]|uniref:S41 family peptidase n=1 Tax=Streptomyces coacervatus TaxID=647381 RepID=A0ABP7IBJ8_9ACTN|nr:S41 family peptidase [Streptomyces coacervatus]MDF2269161.1 S41 family peptidase [Streptomyces coacervatus]
MRIVTATAVILTLAAGAAPTAVADAGEPGTDGLWRMDGYGTVLALGHGVYQEYQTTAVSCLKGDSARQTGPGTYTADGTVLTVRLGRDRDHAQLSADSSVGHRQLRRIGALPEECTRRTPTDPRTAFDVFWQSFEENYPFFAAKGIDWHAVRDRYRSLVHKDTTRSELFDVFSRMVAPLHDAHVAVQDGKRVFAQGRPGTEMPSDTLDARVKKFIVGRDLKDAPYRRDFAAGRITYADLPDGGPGYLRISGFGGYTTADRGSYAANLAELDKALDTVLTADRSRRLPGLIIDLRINGGGSDALGIHIAERLTDRPYIAYAKRARNDPADPTRHTRPEPVPVVPAHAPRYTGPVAVLTGGSTVSAGETFTQALIDRPGRTVRIGQATQGVFSDVMTRKLPDGMTAWLPNEEFLTRTGHTFDGTGIPPQITEPVFTKEEFTNNRDSAFNRAVTLLRP